MADMENRNRRTPEAIGQILKEKTTNVFSLMKKRYERIITLMLCGMLLLVLFFPFISDGFHYPGSINGFVKCMFLYLVLIIFYWEKYKSVNSLEFSDYIKER